MWAWVKEIISAYFLIKNFCNRHVHVVSPALHTTKERIIFTRKHPFCPWWFLLPRKTKSMKFISKEKQIYRWPEKWPFSNRGEGFVIQPNVWNSSTSMHNWERDVLITLKWQLVGLPRPLPVEYWSGIIVTADYDDRKGRSSQLFLNEQVKSQVLWELSL